MTNIVAENEMFFNTFEPVMKNRFVMYIDGVPSYLVKSTSLPSVTMPAKPLHHINVIRYVHGKAVWNPIKLTLFHPVAPSGAQAVIEWIRLHHESVTGRDGYADFYKKDIILNQLGPVGDKVSEWVLKGALVTESNWGEMDWSMDDPVEISLTIQPDYCVLNY